MVLHATPTILQCCETNGSNIVASHSYANLMKTISDNGGGDLVIVKVAPHNVHMFMHTDTLRPYLKTSLTLTPRSHDVNFWRCVSYSTPQKSPTKLQRKKRKEKKKKEPKYTTETSDQATKLRKRTKKIYHRNLRPSDRAKKIKMQRRKRKKKKEKNPRPNTVYIQPLVLD